MENRPTKEKKKHLRVMYNIQHNLCEIRYFKVGLVT